LGIGIDAETPGLVEEDGVASASPLPTTVDGTTGDGVGLEPPANPLIGFEQDHGTPRPDELGGGLQPGKTRPYDDDVGPFVHDTTLFERVHII